MEKEIWDFPPITSIKISTCLKLTIQQIPPAEQCSSTAKRVNYTNLHGTIGYEDGASISSWYLQDK